MGYSGSKISGHSGTEFKHNKVFRNIKKYHQLYQYQDVEYSNDIIEGDKSPVVREKREDKSLLMYNIFVLVFLLLLFGMFKLYMYSNSKAMFSFEQLDETVRKVKVIEDQENFEESLKWGEIFMEKGKLELAETNFKEVLNLDPENELATCRLYEIKDHRFNR